VDSRQAKTVLECYRPGLDDPRSEPFAEAMEQMRRDPELARWLERELALDAAIGAKLRQAPIPPGLQSRILAGRPAVAPVVWWRRPLVVLAPVAAVLIAAVAVVMLAWRSPSGDIASYRGQMAAMVAGDYKLDVEASELPKLREFFAERHWPADYSVPSSLQGYPLEGGMAVEWHGHKVSVICFGAEGDDSKDMWLFVTEPDALPDAPSSEVPEIAPAATLMTASWISAGKLYLFAGRGDEKSLRKYL
jgi:hypothetical protein